MRAAPPVNIAGALIVTALEIALFLFGMRRVPVPMAPSPIAVRLVPLPSQPVPAEAMPMIETEPAEAPPPPPPHRPEPPPKPQPIVETVPPAAPALPAVKPPPRRVAHRPSHPSAAAPSVPRAEGPAPPRPPPAAPGGGTMGARAIYKPLPQIPDELRRRAMNLVAVARFRVGADGGAEVELIRPTPDPRLNRALLEILATWRFFPALRDGSPVASTVDIRIPLKVE